MNPQTCVAGPISQSSKSALWKYLGIGLERARSGKGPEYLGVPLLMHRLLKCTILGAAQSAVAQGDNPFADLHGRWRQQGLSSRLVKVEELFHKGTLESFKI